MTRFDSFAMVDRPGGNQRPVKPGRDATWACFAHRGQVEAPVYLGHCGLAERRLEDSIDAELTAGRRLCLGFDFPFGYPAGFSGVPSGSDDPLGLWAWFAACIEDAPKRNNRFDPAGEINCRFGGCGRFRGNGPKRDIDRFPRTWAWHQNRFGDRGGVEHPPRGRRVRVSGAHGVAGVGVAVTRVCRSGGGLAVRTAGSVRGYCRDLAGADQIGGQKRNEPLDDTDQGCGAGPAGSPDPGGD